MGALRPYQNSALRWFIDTYNNSFGCILSDDVGLGNKVQVLAFLAYLEECRKVVGPHLIVTDEPSTWAAAIEHFLPHATFMEFRGQCDLWDFNICLVSYQTYFSDDFDNCFFHVLIIDQVRLPKYRTPNVTH